MPINRLIRSTRNREHLPGFHSDMNLSPAELYKTFKELGIENQVSEKEMSKWAMELEESLKESWYYTDKKPILNDIIKLYELSGSEILRKSLINIYENDILLSEKAGKALGYSNLKMILDGYPKLYYMKNIIGIIGGSYLVFKLLDYLTN